MIPILEELNRVSDMIWVVLFIVIIALGIYATCVFKGIQFTKIPEMVRCTFSNMGRKNNESSSFRIFCLSMASRIGVGNISGPITAILIGGPGAIFWMWIISIVGSATGFVEATLGQLYKKKDSDGYYIGGPAHNFMYGLNWRKAAVVTAILMALLNIVGFVAVQASAASLSMSNTFQFDGNKLVFAFILTVVPLAIIVGGFKRISDISGTLIPIMAVMWIIICVIAIVINGNIAGAFGMIFNYAFSVPAALGGTIGGMIVIAMKRSILSNEAGLGKSSCVSSSADVKHPVYQGYTQALGVIVDMIVFTCTALVVLSFTGFDPTQPTNLDSLTILHQAFGPLFGDLAPIIVTVFVFAFALSTIYGDYYVAQVNIKFITDKKKWIYASYVLVAVVLFLAALYSDDDIFVVADIFMGLVVAMNLFCISIFFRKVRDVYRDFREQKERGVEEPEFHKSSMKEDSSGITEWD